MVTIENLARRPVSVRLNSGVVLHLPPGASSPELVDAEVQSNSEIQKLQDRLAISLRAATVASDKSAAREASVARPTKRSAGEHRQGDQ